MPWVHCAGPWDQRSVAVRRLAELREDSPVDRFRLVHVPSGGWDIEIWLPSLPGPRARRSSSRFSLPPRKKPKPLRGKLRPRVRR